MRKKIKNPYSLPDIFYIYKRFFDLDYFYYTAYE